MSENALLWLLGVQGFLDVALFGLWWAHVQHCTDRERNAAKLEQKVDHLKEEMGTHETGIIGQLHRYSRAITRIFSKLGMTE